jgi:ubiquinone biosynthesis protein COQ9
MTARPSRQEQRDRLLEAALVHVPFDGWSRRSLRAGAADLGMDGGLARRLFPRGGDDLLIHLEDWADRRMLARIEPAELAGLRMHERIARLVRARLEVLTPHREALRRATAARWLPGNAMAATTSLWRTVDLIWETAGDRARDASYYSKRALLAAVWTSTFLFWLDDRSEALAQTWGFLERRLDNVMRFGKVRSQLEDALTGLGRLNPLSAWLGPARHQPARGAGRASDG